MPIYFLSFIIKLVITHDDGRNTCILGVALHLQINNRFSYEVECPIAVQVISSDM